MEKDLLSERLKSELFTDNLSSLSEDNVHQLGVTIARYRDIGSPIGPETTYLLPGGIEQDILRGDEFYNFGALLDRKDYDGILAWLDERKSTKNTVFAGNTLIGELIQNHEDLPEDFIKLLARKNVTADLYTLVTATKLGLSPAFMSSMLQYSDADIQESWFESHRQMNLTVLAAGLRNQSLFQFWLGRGVPAEVAGETLNAADLFFQNLSTEADEADRRAGG